MIVFLGSGALLGFCRYKLYFSYLGTEPDAMKNVFQVVVGWALLVALYLASWCSQNYRVVIK